MYIFCDEMPEVRSTSVTDRHFPLQNVACHLLPPALLLKTPQTQNTSQSKKFKRNPNQKITNQSQNQNHNTISKLNSIS